MVDILSILLHGVRLRSIGTFMYIHVLKDSGFRGFGGFYVSQSVRNWKSYAFKLLRVI